MAAEADGEAFKHAKKAHVKHAKHAEADGEAYGKKHHGRSLLNKHMAAEADGEAFKHAKKAKTAHVKHAKHAGEA